MISRIDVESWLNGEFQFDQESYEDGGGPLGKEVEKMIGLKHISWDHPSTKARYSQADPLLGLYATFSEGRYDHLWEARRDEGRYLLVHMGDLLDYLIQVDEEDLWVDFACYLIGGDLRAIEGSDCLDWGKIRKLSSDPSSGLTAPHRGILLKASEILEFRENEELRRLQFEAEDGKETLRSGTNVAQ